MPMPAKPLPQMPQVAAAYRQPGASFRILAEQYHVSPGTVRNRLREWAAEVGEDWPLKPRVQRNGNTRDVVDAALVVSEVQYATCKLRVTQAQIADVAGVQQNHLHKITSGHTPRILRATQGKILEAITKIEAGEVELARGPVTLPMPVRDRCPNNHPYTGKRDPATGKRMCSVCRAEKTRRNEDRRSDRTRRKTA